MLHLTTGEPARAAYLVTPERLMQITNTGSRFTEETWTNRDQTSSRGWLVRGKPGAPAVVLLHRYGADRSWLLNLGAKLYGATNFTVLIPDLRGHGENPTVKYTSLGGCEANDLAVAFDFLRAQKNDKGEKLVGQKIGVYGVEIGAIAALTSATSAEDVQALALDSVPASTGDALQSVVGARTAFAPAIAPFASYVAPYYFTNGCYKDTPLCETAKTLANRKILLLAGKDAPRWQESTVALASCFGGANVEKKTDLQPSGYNLIQTATPEQQESYNNLIIEFFRAALQ